jgi:hypothetical protein
MKAIPSPPSLTIQHGLLVILLVNFKDKIDKTRKEILNKYLLLKINLEKK